MNTFFVRAVVNINCTWSGDNPPAYRVFVNNELFTERAYVANQEQFIKLKEAYDFLNKIFLLLVFSL